MSILSFKPGHDGNIAYLRNGRLIFSYEGEKDSFPRYSGINSSVVIDALTSFDKIPDVIAVSGWIKGPNSHGIIPIGSGYNGVDAENIETKKIQFLGKSVDYYSSSHVRSHIMASYGMSPFEQGEPCYMLLWEGSLGFFYEIDEHLNVKTIGRVMNQPGQKYSFLYLLAAQEAQDNSAAFAGKLMALAGFSDRQRLTKEELKTANFILNKNANSIRKSDMSWSSYYNVGVDNEGFKQFAGKFSDLIFDAFYSFATKHCTKGYPLLIGGGCGLNCEWNSRWKNSGLFQDVFIPPVTNDTGSAIGTAIDAYYHFTGQAKVSWDVYCGTPFQHDENHSGINSFKVQELDLDYVARLLAQDKILALVQGNCEIGPRALGNRSIIASPFKKETHIKLNSIKGRESYRPIAPLCLEDDVSEFFDWEGPSPYMLFFQKVKNSELKAITHVDQTARLQTVNQNSNQRLFNILTSFKKLTEFGVLCNTSLNFNGRGFINNMSDLIHFVEVTELDGFILENKLYLKKGSFIEDTND